MANILVKNVPEKIYSRLRRHAREQGCAVSEIVLQMIKREIARRQWHKRLFRRPKTELRSTAAELLREERRQRDGELR
jgi:hypothetical protein